jgi:hypothetical protein
VPRSALLALLVERPSSVLVSASAPAPGAAAPRPRGRGAVVGRRPLVEAAVAALVVTLLYLVLRPDPVRTFGAMYDDAVYVSLGRAIALGHGYRSDHLVGAPVHEKFPPGLPALYALLWRLGGTLEATLRLALMASIAAVGAAGGLVWYYSRRVLANGVTTSAVLALQPLLFLRSLRYFSGAASEPWFLLCWAAALVLAWRITERADSRRIAFAVALGLVLAAATLVRTQGVVLLPAVLIALLAARVPRAAVGAVLAAALVPLAAWRLALARMVATGPVASQPDQVAYSSWIPHGSVGEFAAFVGRVLAVNVPGLRRHRRRRGRRLELPPGARAARGGRAPHHRRRGAGAPPAPRAPADARRERSRDPALAVPAGPVSRGADAVHRARRRVRTRRAARAPRGGSHPRRTRRRCSR